MEFTPLQESLLQLAALKSQLESALRTMVPEDRVKDEDLKFTVCNHIQILLCSFLEEWKIFESLGRDKRIRDTLKIASPALDRIRRWRGLRKVRSTLLAHGLRDRKGAPAWPWVVFKKYEAPTAYAETILLGNCALLAIEVALARHLAEYKEATCKLLQMNRDIEDKGIRTVGEIKIELDKIKVEMLRIARVLHNCCALDRFIYCFKPLLPQNERRKPV